MDISFTNGLSQQLMDMDQDPNLIQQYQRNSQSNPHGHFSFQTSSMSKSMPEFGCTSAYDSLWFSELISFQHTNISLPLPSNTQNSNQCLEYCTIKPKDGRISPENLMAMQTLRAQKSGQGNRVISRSPSQAQEHVLAERSRREKMNQQFMALSAIIPGIKKMNKASVLEGAIRHLKELQEREKKLVELTKTKASCSTPEDFGGRYDEQSLPDIVIRVSDNNVLIRIHCQKQNTCAFISNILSQIEKLHLVVTDSRTVPFGNYAVDVTIVAQMDVKFCINANELMSDLRLALSEFI